MDPQAEQLELLSDAVDRVIASPLNSHCWEDLMALTRAGTVQPVQDTISQLLQAHVPGTGLAGFHRALYLDLTTGDAQHLADASRALQHIVPADADRLARYHYFAWQRLLILGKDGGGLVQQLSQAGLPAIAAQLGAALARITPNRLPPRAKGGQGNDGTVSTVSTLGAGPDGRPGVPARVAVVAPHLLDSGHPPTVMAMDQCAVLARQGVHVELFCCQEPAGPGFDHLLANGSGLAPPEVDLSSWQPGDAQGARHVHLGDTRYSLLRRGAAMLERIAAFDPDLVLFVGLQSVLLQSLHAARPVVGLCVNSIPPMVPADVFLSTHRAWHGQRMQPWGDALPASLAWHHPWRVWRKTAARPLARADLQLEAGQVVLVTVGGMLKTRITGPWAAAMAEAMERHPQLVWMIVGDEGQPLPALAQVPAHRLRLLPRSGDVPALLDCADIYAHPPIPGGGFAVAEAMSHGLTVLALAGFDGGDKLGADAVADFAAYFALLDACVKDAGLRRARGQRHQRHFHEQLDLAQSGPGLLAACAAAIARYQERVNPAS